ncbi:MAG: S1C family serine protease [Mycobacteriales bacterium]
MTETPQYPYQGPTGPSYGYPPPPFAPTGAPAPAPPPAPPGQVPPALTPAPGAAPRSTRRGAALIAAVLVAGVGGGLAGGALEHRSGGTKVVQSSPTVNAKNASDQASALSAVAKAILPSVVEVTVRTAEAEGIGSGIVLSSDGRILTNNHVVSGASGGTITVTFSNGKTANATVVGTDASSDLAVIKAQDVSGLTPATLGDSSKVTVGQEVVAVGSPEGLQGTVTSGIVSALNRTVTVQSDESNNGRLPFQRSSDGGGTVTYKAIQTDASINPGNSGGPLVDMQGHVIGINSAIYSPTSAVGSQGGSVGLGFSIPIDQAKTIIAKLQT